MKERYCVICGKQNSREGQDFCVNLNCSGRLTFKKPSSITVEELHEICELTFKLVELRQNECKHLCIENIAPEIFACLLGDLKMHKDGLVKLPANRDAEAKFNP